MNPCNIPHLYNLLMSIGLLLILIILFELLSNKTPSSNCENDLDSFLGSLNAYFRVSLIIC
jgi:hypothetical protein